MPMKKKKKTARLFYCACCWKRVQICSRCDRGNIYCESTCSRTSRLLNHRIANQKYQCSLKGRQKHADRQRRYRERQKATEKKVTDHRSRVLPPHGLLPDQPNEELRQTKEIHCHFCGELVSPLLRHGFLHYEAGLVSSSWPLGP